MFEDDDERPMCSTFGQPCPHAGVNCDKGCFRLAARRQPEPKPAPRAVDGGSAIRLVILESPYAGDVDANVAYARACVRDALLRGEAPIASHLLYTQPGVLRDEVSAERKMGIDAGLAWRSVADASVVYTDLGVSEGMKYGIEAAKRAGIPVEFRTLGAEAKP